MIGIKVIRAQVFMVVVLILGATVWPLLGADNAPEIDIPYEKFVLDNGLILIVHEDHKAPIVAVNMWYHVGSKNEKPGRTGFAHLFEHLMFNGSENFDDDYFIPLEKVGATDLNGTTNEDRTNYFQNVPRNALDLVLWMESDRMGHLLGAIDQDKLDEQRGVVQNEKRQFENMPYSMSWELITRNTFPEGHPYSWTVIGSMEDLNAASLDDVHQWFKDYYGAANAVIAIAGDVDSETARQKVEKYFGDIPAGPPVTRQDVWIPGMTGTHRQVAQDRVPLPRIYKVWNMPQWGSEDATYLDLVSDVLAAGKNSRLYKRLVYEDQIASTVSSYVDPREISGQLYIEATAQQGVPLEDVEKAIDEELEAFLKRGPDRKEMERVKIQYRSRFVRGIERIGGFGGKSDILAMNEVYGGRPDYYKTTLARVDKATGRDLKEAARRWLSEGVYILEIHPFESYATAVTDVDRSGLPDAGSFPELEFPQLQKTTLSNGLSVILAERGGTPVVNFQLILDGGYAADQFGVPGTASMAMAMLDEGTRKRSALEIGEELDRLGARLSAGASLDVSTVSLSALKENLGKAVEIFADVILNPSFPNKELERLKKERLASIDQEKANPITMALRVFPHLLYGKGHAYSNPLTGTGTAASTQAMTRQDLLTFHKTWFQPDNATMVVVGDITLDGVSDLMEARFGSWVSSSKVPEKSLHDVPLPPSSRVYLIDKPDAVQSFILAGHLAPPTNNPDEIPIQTMNSILGGTFTSRINMNLREDKHWSYGARSFLWGARGQRMFVAWASVQTDKTRESLVELNRELNDILGSRPPSQSELLKAQDTQTLRLPGRFETLRAVEAAIVEMVEFGIPEDYYETYPERVRALKRGDISGIAKKILHPDNLIWLIVGDRQTVEEGIRSLGLGEVEVIDPEDDGGDWSRTGS